jgi:Ca2+-binding EF-hand superfamily protein
MITSISNSNHRAQAAEAMRQNRFKKIDQDGDGKITPDELKAAIPAKGKGPSVEDIFSKVDTNQDGVIDEAEDKVAFQQMQGHRPPAGPPDPSKIAAKLFEKADSDSDGKITKDELLQVLPKKHQASLADTLMKAADTDEDGSITQSELETALKKVIEEMQAKREQAAAEGTTDASYDKAGCSRHGRGCGKFSAVA